MAHRVQTSEDDSSHRCASRLNKTTNAFRPKTEERPVYRHQVANQHEPTDIKLFFKKKAKNASRFV